VKNTSLSSPESWAVLTAIVYNSWPLGYLLNPAVARNGVASVLEASHQPYDWLFIGGDVTCGLLTLLIACLVIRRGGLSRLPQVALSGILVFGVMTAVSALMPLDCSSGAASCGYGPGQSFNLHNFTGGLAAFGLFIAMVPVVGKFGLKDIFKRKDAALLVLWSLWGLWYLFVAFKNAGVHSVWHETMVVSQEVFLVLSGLSFWLVIRSIVHSQQD
jgi:uncharacterized protein DUF998